MGERLTFESLGLSADLVRMVAEEGYEQPTPVQEAAIPEVLAGRDVLAAAQTGTGKTAAFLLPTLDRLRHHANTSFSPARHAVRVLILVPTRELAMQVDEFIRTYGRTVPLRAAVVFGGVPLEPQTKQLLAGVEILAATPGRLLDHIGQRAVNLSQVEVLVLDEADRMLDMGFLPDILRILNALPAERQTLMFSATIAPEIRKLADDILRDPVVVMVGTQKPVSGIVHSVYPVAQARKGPLLTTLLRREAMHSVLVFVKRKSDADQLARAIARSGVRATSIHSDRRQEDRIAALEAFRRGDYPVLVATDVAARGLDVEGISHIVNFDVPFSSDDYIHRGGRTARAGAAGDVITFVSPAEEVRLRDIERGIGATLPRVVLPNFDHGTHSHVPLPVRAPARPGRSRRRRRSRGSRGKGS